MQATSSMVSQSREQQDRRLSSWTLTSSLDIYAASLVAPRFGPQSTLGRLTQGGSHGKCRALRRLSVRARRRAPCPATHLEGGVLAGVMHEREALTRSGKSIV